MTVPLPSRAPHPPRRAFGRTALRNCLVVVAALVLLVILVAGCGAQGALPAAAPSTVAPTTPAPPTSPTAPGTGTRAAPGTPAPSVPGGVRAPTPIWPVSDTASARRLQREVDGGSQPWLLDPLEVATSYAGAELGYAAPAATPRGPGVVEVRDTGSPRSATVSLAQTVLRGDGGIWLVTGVGRR